MYADARHREEVIVHLFGQTPSHWAELLNHSVAIGVLAFIGVTATWWLRRTYGKEGTDTRRAEVQMACEQKNSDTMAANAITLVELKNLAASQQDLCSRHAGALEKVSSGLTQVSDEIKTNADAAEELALKYKSPRHYKTTYLVDLAGEMVDTFGRIAKNKGLDIDDDLEPLRTKVTEAKLHMHPGDVP